MSVKIFDTVDEAGRTVRVKEISNTARVMTSDQITLRPALGQLEALDDGEPLLPLNATQLKGQWSGRVLTRK